ncbi:hypothetical protein ACWF95_41410 [Streptomyces vinaceus]
MQARGLNYVVGISTTLPAHRPQRLQTDVPTVRGPADPARRTRGPPSGRRTGTARVLALARMADQPGRTRSVLAVRPACRHPADHPGPPGQAPLAHRARLPRDETGPGPGPLRGPHLHRLAPPRRPRLRRARPLHPATTGRSPKRHGVGLSLYRIVRELQTLLATWTGACPTCHRDIPTPTST